MKLAVKFSITLIVLFGLMAAHLWLVELAIDRRETEFQARQTWQRQDAQLLRSIVRSLAEIEQLLGSTQMELAWEPRRSLQRAAAEASARSRLHQAADPFSAAVEAFESRWANDTRNQTGADDADLRRRELLRFFHHELRPAAAALERASTRAAADDESSLHALRGSLQWQNRLGLVAFLAVALAAGVYWHRLLIHPLRRLESDARDLHAGRRSAIRHSYQGFTEFDELSDAVNSALDAVKAKSLSHDELAQLVAQRSAELHASAQRLDLALEASSTGTWDCDLTADRIHLDVHWCAMTGYQESGEPRSARALLELVHPEDKPEVMRAFRRCIHEGTDDYVVEHRVRHADGRWLWLLSHGRVVARDSVGRAARMIGTNTDTSARREAEQALGHSRARLEHLLANAPVTLHCSDAQPPHRARFISTHVEELIGFRAETLLEQPGLWAECLHPDDRERVLKDLHTVPVTGSLTHEYRIRHRDGSWRSVQDTLRLVTNPIDHSQEIVGHCIDVTARNTAEASARAQQEQTLLFQSTLLALRDHEGEARPDFFRLATEVVARALRVERASIWLFEPTRTAIVCADLYRSTPGEHSSGSRLGAAEYPAHFIAASRFEPIMADDVHTHPETAGFSADYLAPLGISSLLDVPIRVGGQLAGALRCEHVGPCRRWTTEESKFAIAAASYLMLALEQAERRRVEAVVTKQLDFFAALNQTAIDLLSRSDRNALLQAIVQRSSILLDAPYAELALLDGDELVVHGLADSRVYPLGERVSRAQGPLSWRAIETGEPIVLTDYTAHPESRESLRQWGFRAAAVFPILCGPVCLGVLVLLRKEPDRPFTPTEVAEARLFTQLAALVLHQATIYEDAVRLADERNVELRQREATYRNLVESINEGYYVADAPGRFTYCSPALEALGGFRRGELLGTSSFRLIAEEDRARIVKTYRAWRADPNVHDVHCEFQVVAKSGRKFWVEQSTHFERNAVGHVTEGRNVVHDISARKAAEMALRESEGRFQLVNRAVFNVIWDQDLLTDAIWWSEQFTAIYGHDRAAASANGEFWRAHLHPDDRARVVAAVVSTLAGGGETWRDEYRFRRADGTYAHVEDRAHIVREPAGRPVRLIGAMQDVTERERAVRAVRDSEARYRALMESSGDGILLIDTVGRIRSANPAAERMHGYSPGEMLGCDIRRLDSPESDRLALERIGRVLAGETLTFEVDHMRKDGSLFPVEVIAKTVMVGGESFILYTQRDITRRRRAEIESQRLAILARDTNMAVVIADTTGRVEWTNAGFTALTGYTLDEVRGRPPGAFLRNPGADSATRSLIREKMRAREPVETEILNLSKHGDSYWVHLTIQPMRDPTGEFIGFFATSFDVTDRKLTSEALKFLSVQATAFAGATYFDEVARFLATLLAVDHSFVCDYVPGNHTCFHAHSYSRGAPSRSGDPGRMHALAQKACARLVDLPFFHVPEHAAQLFPADSLLLERRISGYAAVEIRDVQGRVLGFLGVMHGGVLRPPERLEALLRLFAVRVASEMARQQTEQHLRQTQKLESLGTLAGGIAHDFNNILTGMLGFVELARFELPSDHEARQWLDGIGSSGLRARDLVRQILTFSRKGEGALAPIALEPVVREALKLIRSSLPAMVHLEETVAPDCPMVLANATQIHQVVMNLCTNAWQALPSTGGHIRVTLAPCALDVERVDAQPGAYLRLTVEDNGCGMSPEVAERVFEPFFTTKETGHGTGLGLAVVHGVVRSHGGSITMRSTPDVGTNLEILFPALAEEGRPAPKAPADNQSVGGRERILFVDDDRDARTPLTILLTRLGYEVEEVEHPVDAVSRFARRPDAYDLVITDFAMPALSGAALIRSVRTHRPGMPIILISGFVDAERKQELEECGASLILRKPVSLDELASAVRRGLAPPAPPGGRS
ncbi:MAG: hypothetical protein C0518_01650 [Opitutus sp.]|nr:hypothetical protein [Opitutus sp.]